MSQHPMNPEPDFRHLLHMTDERATFEHALFREPRPEHGYCTDDMARVRWSWSPANRSALRRSTTWRS